MLRDSMMRATRAYIRRRRDLGTERVRPRLDPAFADLLAGRLEQPQRHRARRAIRIRRRSGRAAALGSRDVDHAAVGADHDLRAVGTCEARDPTAAKLFLRHRTVENLAADHVERPLTRKAALERLRHQASGAGRESDERGDERSRRSGRHSAGRAESALHHPAPMCDEVHSRAWQPGWLPSPRGPASLHSRPQVLQPLCRANAAELQGLELPPSAALTISA